MEAYLSAVFAHLNQSVFLEEHPYSMGSIERGVKISMMGYLDNIWRNFETFETEEKGKFAWDLIENTEAFFISQIDRWWRMEGHLYPIGDSQERIKKTLEEWNERQKQSEPLPLFENFEEDIKRHGGAYLADLGNLSFPLR